MSSFISSYAVLGVVASFFGVGMLWYSWVNRKKSIPLIIIGWSTIIMSLTLWGYAAGSDRGTAMGLLGLGVVALIFVAINAAKITPSQNRNQKPDENDFVNLKKLKGKTIFKNIGWLLLLSLGCGISAYFAILGFHELFIFGGTHLSNALFWSLFLFPIIWGLLAIHMLAGESLKNRSLSLLGCCLFGAVMIVWGN